MKQRDFERRVASAGGLDRVMGRWQVLDVHQVPQMFGEHDEVDFYCSNGTSVYLLRVRARAERRLTVVSPKPGSGYPTYLVAELPNPAVNDALIASLLEELSSLRGAQRWAHRNSNHKWTIQFGTLSKRGAIGRPAHRDYLNGPSILVMSRRGGGWRARLRAAMAGVVAVAVLAGCAGAGSSPEDPLPVGTPVQLTLADPETGIKVKWEVTLTGLEQVDKADNQDGRSENYSKATCWVLFGTLTQLEGPAATRITPIGFPAFDGLSADGVRTRHTVGSACNNFELYSEQLPITAGYDPFYSDRVMNWRTLANGESRAFWYEIASFDGTKPSIIEVDGQLGRVGENPKYINMAVSGGASPS